MQKKNDKGQDVKSHAVSTQLTTEVYEKLLEKARAEDRKVGYIIRRAILNYVGLDSRTAS